MVVVLVAALMEKMSPLFMKENQDKAKNCGWSWQHIVMMVKGVNGTYNCSGGGVDGYDGEGENKTW